MDLPPTHQHQGQTATGDKLKWERGLMHDPAEKYTPGRTHGGTIHVWIHPSVCSSMDPCCARTDRRVDKLDGQ